MFTEAIARLFEIRPDICLAWLEEVGALPPGYDSEALRVRSQRSFAPLDHRGGKASRPDLLIEIYNSQRGSVEQEGVSSVVMIESKIGSKEGDEQLRRYAEHLSAMDARGKTLLYVTCAYDPKEEAELLRGLDDVRFVQRRWHDFHRLTRGVESDALVEEVATFMEEQGMARSYRFSTTDLLALSGVPRAFEIFDETLSGEVKTELESFAGNRARRESVGLDMVRRFGIYHTTAQLHGDDLYCNVGYVLRTADGYPLASVTLQTKPRASRRETSIAAMGRIALRDGREGIALEDPEEWSYVTRTISLADLLTEEDHISAAKRFFTDSIGQLREVLTTFKKDHPDLLWGGA